MVSYLLLMNPRILSNEQEAVLASEYIAGATCEALAARYGCSHGTVQNALRRQHISRRTHKEAAAHRKVLTPDAERSLVQEYQNGLSLEVLALKFGSSPGTIRNTLVRLGVPRRSCGQHPPNPAPKTKRCSSCGLDLPFSAFYTEGKRSSECQECVGRKQSHKYDTDPMYRQNRIDAERRRKTGWTTGQFEAMWEDQRGLCAICRAPMNKKGRGNRSVCADHDHATNQLRSLLCSNCNRGLGYFTDSPEKLRRAATYLEDHSKVLVGVGT